MKNIIYLSAMLLVFPLCLPGIDAPETADYESAYGKNFNSGSAMFGAGNIKEAVKYFTASYNIAKNNLRDSEKSDMAAAMIIFSHYNQFKSESRYSQRNRDYGTAKKLYPYYKKYFGAIAEARKLLSPEINGHTTALKLVKTAERLDKKLKALFNETIWSKESAEELKNAVEEANAAFKRGDNKLAADLYVDAINKYEITDFRIYQRAGLSYYRQSMLKEAAPYFKQYSEKAPEDLIFQDWYKKYLNAIE